MMRILEWTGGIEQAAGLSRTSAAQRTKLAATKSKPSSAPKSRSSRSCWLMYGIDAADTPGTFTPLCVLHLPVCFPPGSGSRASVVSSTVRRTRPSSSRIVSPCVDVLRQRAVADGAAGFVAHDILGRECERLPRLQVYGAVLEAARALLQPFVSSIAATGRCSCPRSFFTASSRARCSSCVP